MKIAKTTPLRNASAFFHFGRKKQRKKIEFNNKVERLEQITGIFPTYANTHREKKIKLSISALLMTSCAMQRLLYNCFITINPPPCRVDRFIFSVVAEVRNLRTDNDRPFFMDMLIGKSERACCCKNHA